MFFITSHQNPAVKVHELIFTLCTYFATDDVGKGIFSMVHIKSVEEYEDEEYHEYSDDDDDGDEVFEATTFHPNSVLPAEAMDKASLIKYLEKLFFQIFNG